MVKGQLKVLRHKRTEAGYFNEFLIAKTPDDVENCLPALVMASADDPEADVVFADTGSASVTPAAQFHTLHQATRQDFPGASVSSASLEWCHHHQQQQRQQQQQTGPQFGHGQPDQMASSAADIARQEVVVTSAGSRQQLDMAAGMGKMKISLGNATTREATRRSASTAQPPLPHLPQLPLPLPRPSSTSDESPESESQRRRRERNRAAAARCRKKRQDQLDCLSEAVRDLEAENASLESRVASLMAARSDLLRQLREHQVICSEITALDPLNRGLEITMDTELASLATQPGNSNALPGQEILLTPSLLLPPPLPLGVDCTSGEFKLEPL